VSSVDPNSDELFIHELDDGGVAKGTRVELGTPETMIGADIDDERAALLLSLAAGGVVIGAPLDLRGSSRGYRTGKQDQGNQQAWP
jgi:hypothetical protein